MATSSGESLCWPAARSTRSTKSWGSYPPMAVPAPALETYELIDELVARGHASVDVEGGAVLQAVHALRAGRPEITFTPVYTHSDDPRASRHDPFDSLAMMGPLFEGSTFDPDLYDLVYTLLDLTQAPPEGGRR